MFPAVVCIPTVGTLLMVFWLDSYLPEDWYYPGVLGNVLLYGLDLASYVKAIRVTNGPVPARPPKQGPSPPWLHEAYRRDRRCEKESEEQWKPPRTSHCHACGCVLRMDHHCVWINQCVGVRNHRAFLLFVLYSWLIAALYLLLSLNFYFYHFEAMNFLMNGLWLTWTGLGVILVLSLGSMLTMQLYFILLNTTQLELMKNLNPTSPFRIQLCNIYDMGVVANLIDFFEGDTFFWWLPKARQPLFDGCDYNKLPPVTREQVNALPPK